jgi:hypothetical protein
MLHKAIVILFAVGCFAVSAATLVTGSTRIVSPKHEVAYGYVGARHAPAKLLGGCLEEPVECGLVVW